MTEKINVYTDEDTMDHPEPIASTSTPYDDEDEEQKSEEKITINLEDYFEVVLMTSPVAGIKLYIPKHEPSNAHVLMIQKSTRTAKKGRNELHGQTIKR